MARDLIDAARGALLGTMVGDAMGMPAKGLTRAALADRFGRLDSLREGELPAGEFTDETEMTLGLCEALVSQGGFDLQALAEGMANNFTPWRGYSPHVYGIMARIRQGMEWDLPGTTSWGAGAATRVAPLGVLYAEDSVLIEHAAAQATITHPHPNGQAGAIAQALAVSAATVNGLFEAAPEPEMILSELEAPLSETSVALSDTLIRIGDLNVTGRPEDLAATIAKIFPCDGTAVGTIPAALAAFVHTQSFEEAVIAAVNCAGSADTMGALTGALAGAFYGAEAIPERLTEGLANEERGRDFALALGDKLGKLTRKRSGKKLEGELED